MMTSIFNEDGSLKYVIRVKGPDGVQFDTSRGHCALCGELDCQGYPPHTNSKRTLEQFYKMVNPKHLPDKHEK